MDLLNLAAKITLDDSQYKKGIEGAESAGKALAGKMSAMTVAVGNIAADMMRKAAGAISSVVKGAVDGYADYQQLIGGVETLFKTSASKVAKYAQQSFKTTGLSANQYMETVTSFSASLLQGLKGDTEQAADLADMAITDMADNANKMGTDISSIQAAYQGFAKQNYTMLDNLKLGYGGTASEMVRLVNDSGILEKEIKDLDDITFDQLVLAIHSIQSEMGITGTTAAEAAETISGSKASLEASWADFLSAIGGEADQKRLNEASENFQQAFNTYIVKNLAPTIKTTIKNAPALISAVADAITALPTEAVKELMTGGVSILTAGVNGATDIAGWLLDGLIEMFTDVNADPSKVAELGESVGKFLGDSLTKIVENAPTIVSGIVTAGMSLAGGLVEGLFKGLFGEGAEVDKITEQLQDDLTDIDVNNAEATALLRYMDKLYEKYGDGVKKTNEWKEAQEQLEAVLPAAGDVFNTYGNDIQGAIDRLNTLNEEMRKSAIIAGIQKALREEQELLGEQMATAELARTRAENAQTKRDVATEGIQESLKAYAQRALDLYGGDERVGEQVKAEWARLANGQISVNDQVYGFDEVDLDELSNAINSLVSFVDEGDESVWSDKLDKIYDPETLGEFFTNIKLYTNEIDKQIKIAEDAEKEAQKTQTEIDTTLAALEKTVKQRYEESAGKAAESVETGGADVEKALIRVAGKISSIRISGGGVYFTPEATGIDDVPYDGFKASLHKGETVLTRSEADKYRNGDGTADVVGAIQGLRTDMQSIQLVVGKKTFGQAVVNYGGGRMKGYIGQSDSREYAGYGT